MEAAIMLKKKWTSLPTIQNPFGSEEYKNIYTIQNLFDDYHRFLSEETAKGL